MEYEKINILNENLKQRLETQTMDNRDMEKRLKEKDKLLLERDKRIEALESRVEELNEKMLDLKLQVREEAIKNTKLDQQLEALNDIKDQLVTKNEEIGNLKHELEETKILMLHAKKSWKEERDKVKHYEDTVKEDKSKEEEMELTKSENTTLKRLVLAKDTVLIQKSQILENLRNVINKHDNDQIDVERIRKILHKKPVIKPTFPTGNKAKEEQLLTNGDVEPLVNGWLHDAPQSNNKYPSQQKGILLNNLLMDDNERRHYQNGYVLTSSREAKTTSTKQLKPVVVKPKGYQSSSFSNFRGPTESVDSLDHSSTNTHHYFANIKNRWHTTKDVRSDHSDNKSKSSPKSSQSGKAQSSDTSKLKRSKSAEHSINIPGQSNKLETFRPPSPSTWSHKTVSITTVGSTGSGSISAVMLRAAPDMDRKYCRIVRNGDRVVVDMAKSKEKRKANFQAGVVKFIGNLDKEYDCYRVYIGLRLDDPAGDTDGIYKGRRYFKVTANHGKFVRITRIVNVYNKEKGKFEEVKEILKQLGLDDPNDHADEDDKRFELDI